MECDRGVRMKARGVESAQDVVKRGSLKEDDAEGGERGGSSGVRSTDKAMSDDVPRTASDPNPPRLEPVPISAKDQRQSFD
jgi:hypothetical protein